MFILIKNWKDYFNFDKKKKSRAQEVRQKSDSPPSALTLFATQGRMGA